MNTAAIILAAGRSRRMGFPKYALAWDAHTTFLEKIIHEYHDFGCDEIILVMNPEAKLIKKMPVHLVINSQLDYGRFYSLKLALKQISNPGFCFLQNVDNPFVHKGILEKIYESRDQEGYVSPRFQSRGGHPILFGEKICKHIKNLERNDCILHDVLQNFHKIPVAMDDDIVLRNINTPELYREYFS